MSGRASITERVRQIYERWPYPAPASRKPKLQKAPIPLEWVGAVWRPTGPLPKRVLVAGCGVGTEACAVAVKLPTAEVIGADLSPRSITSARRLARMNRQTRRVRFEVADLATADLAKVGGGSFDLITCHGVLSYLPKPERALKNLARCLTPGGALLLGVNGATHFSTAWRKVLPGFGVDLEIFRDNQQTRALLRLCDALSSGEPSISGLDAGFLAVDLFGPLNRALPLRAWAHLCVRAGLHLMGS